MNMEKIKAFVVETFLFGDGRDLTETTPLLENHIVDSTGVLEIVAFLEERFKICIEDADLTPENLNSVRSINEYLKRKNAAID